MLSSGERGLPDCSGRILPSVWASACFVRLTARGSGFVSAYRAAGGGLSLGMPSERPLLEIAHCCINTYISIYSMTYALYIVLCNSSDLLACKV